MVSAIGGSLLAFATGAAGDEPLYVLSMIVAWAINGFLITFLLIVVRRFTLPLKFIASKNKLMAKVMEGFPFLEGSAETVVIAKAPKPFDTYFDDSEKNDKLRALGLQFVKRDVKIKVSGQNREGESRPPKQTPQAPPHPQGVQDVLNMFQGEIRGEVSEDQRRKGS